MLVIMNSRQHTKFFGGLNRFRCRPHQVFEAWFSQHLHLQNLAVSTRIELVPTAWQAIILTDILWDQNLCGVTNGERSHTTDFTERGANLYTIVTIEYNIFMPLPGISGPYFLNKIQRRGCWSSYLWKGKDIKILHLVVKERLLHYLLYNYYTAYCISGQLFCAV